MKSDILVFGTMGNIAEIASSALRKHGLSVARIDFPQSTFRDETGYERALRKAIDDCNPDMILPVGNLRAISRIKERLSDDIFIPVDCESKISVLDSKAGASRLSSELSIPQPRIFHSAEEAEGHRVIFKKDISFGGSGIYKPRTKEALQHLIEREEGKEFIIEEYIEGEDFSIDAIRWDGYFRAECYRSLGNKGQGPALEREKTVDTLIYSYAREILYKIDYKGICGMDFRIDRQGNRFFLECNPRLTGGLECQIKSGFDIPFILYSLMKQNPDG